MIGTEKSSDIFQLIDIGKSKIYEKTDLFNSLLKD